MATLTTTDVADFRSQLKWLLNRKHVGVSDDEILADIRTRLNQMRRDGIELTDGFEKGIEKLALRIHHDNFKLYSQVMTGRLGPRRRRKNPQRSTSWTGTYSPKQIANQLLARLRLEGLDPGQYDEDLLYAAGKGNAELLSHLVTMDTDMRKVIAENDLERGRLNRHTVQAYRNSLEHVRGAIHHMDRTLRRARNPRRRVKVYSLTPATAIRQMRDAMYKMNWGADLTGVLTDIAHQAGNHPAGVALDQLRQVKRILKGDVGSDELQQIADIIEWQDPISRTRNPHARPAISTLKRIWRVGQRVRLRFRGRWSPPGRIISLNDHGMGLRIGRSGADVPWSDVRKGDVKRIGAPRKKRAKRGRLAKRRSNGPSGNVQPIWTIYPKDPWQLQLPDGTMARTGDGRYIRRWPTAEAALAWWRKVGSRAKRRSNETLGEAITDAWLRRDAEKMGRLDAYFRNKGWRQTDVVMFLQDALRKRGIHPSNRNWPERRDYDALMYELEG